MGDNRQLRGVICAFLGAVCWGFSATCASLLMSTYNMDVLWLAATRMSIAGPSFLLAAFIFDREKLIGFLRDHRRYLQMLAYTLIGVVLMQVGYMSTIKYTNAGTALLLQQTGLVLIMLFTCVRMRRSPKKREAIALVLALVGTASIATQGQVGALGISGIGLFWGLMTGIALAGHNLIPGQMLKDYGSLVMNGVSMTLAGILLMPFARPWETKMDMPLEGWLVFAAIVVVGTFLAYMLYMQGIADAGPVKASLIAVTEPVSGMVFSAVWLGTIVTVFDLLGCVAIVSMMILIAKPDKS